MTTTGSVLVVYATAAGSTQEIAEFIGKRLADSGLSVEVRSVIDNPNPADYSAVVVGSAVHNGRWLPVAVDFVHNRLVELVHDKVWMFSVGMAPDLRGPIGRRMARAVPGEIARLGEKTKARDYASFAGVYSPEDESLGARLLYRIIGGGRYGDLRDWGAIDAWAGRIAAALKSTH